MPTGEIKYTIDLLDNRPSPALLCLPSCPISFDLDTKYEIFDETSLKSMLSNSWSLEALGGHRATKCTRRNDSCTYCKKGRQIFLCVTYCLEKRLDLSHLKDT